MPTQRAPQTFTSAFEICLQNRTGISITCGGCRYDELQRDLERALRANGFAGDDPPGNEALKQASEPEVEMSDDLHGPKGLLDMVEKLGPRNINLSSEVFVKPFFRHLNLSQRNITSLDEDIVKFKNLSFLDVSRNGMSRVENLAPSLKFLKAYNNTISQIVCGKQPSLSFLGAGYNALTTVGMSDLSQRFANLVSLDLCYNNLSNLREFVLDAQSLTKLKHLCLAGNPLCLLPYYRLVIIKHLPQLLLLDEQSVGEAEVADSQSISRDHLAVPQHINLAISFDKVFYLKRLLIALAEQLPGKQIREDGIEVSISEEERIAQIAQRGRLFFKFKLPGTQNDDASWIETTDVAIEEPPPEEPVVPAKGKKGEVVEPPPKAPGEPIDLTGLRVVLAAPSENPQEQALDSVDVEKSPQDSPLFFPLPICNNDPDARLLELRDWLRVGMPVQALYRKIQEPIDPEVATTTPAVEGEQPEEKPATPAPEVPIVVGGGILSLSQVLWPMACSPEDLQTDATLPVIPPAFSIQPAALVLAPVQHWLDPDVQVPLAPSAKSLSDISASVSMDVCLYSKEATPEENVDTT